MRHCTRSHTRSHSVSQGYFDDPFVRHFVRTPRRHPPLINLGYFSRVAAVRRVVDAFVQPIALSDHSADGTSVQRQIVTLGAGFDTLPLRLARLAVRVCELDFPSVVGNKLQLLASVPELRRVLPVERERAHAPFVSPRFVALGVDLAHAERVEAQLRTANIDFSLPTLILSEVSRFFGPPRHQASFNAPSNRSGCSAV